MSSQLASGSFPSNPARNYEVFLSFRGEDTRHNFTDHLYTELIRRGITTFRDDDQLRRGEEIRPEILKAIEESRSSVVVFSKNYADSRWCLEELAKITERRRESGQIVLPIFYHVDPSDVRKQTGSYGEAFTKHDYEENLKDKVERWREALTEAGNISGWHVNQGYESKHIKEITTIIANRIMNCKLLFVEDNLVGMDSHFKKLSLGLSMESNDVRVIGICGTGGIGKTTIARYVYNQISWGFECSSFLEKVSEVHQNKGLLHLQNQLVNDMLDGGNLRISNVSQGAYILKNSLHSLKALIVFDDMNDMDLLECLVGNHDWYCKGSRIIITTRDKHLLTMLKVDYLYEVEQLNFDEALKLFCQYAFRSNLLKEDFNNLVDSVIYYCEGLPLALKVLGSFLCDKTMSEWESELQKLEREPVLQVQNVLKISFDGLDATQKVVFLDIVCFFEGEDRDFASKIFDGCNLYGEINIRVLWERCLITISHNRIYLHNLIQKMGWKIVQEQYPDEPSKWSRLWNPNDIWSAFMSEKGMQNVETISLNLSILKEKWFDRKISDQMKKRFANMKKLRLLKVYYGDRYEGCVLKESNDYKMLLPKGFEFPPNLRYLHWEGLKYLPSNFHGEHLVAINLNSSNIKKLWKGKKHQEKLKFIDVSYSRQLLKMPNFSRMPNLERLNLDGCISLCKLHSSIGAFSDMKLFKELRLSGIGISELPSSIGSLTSLEILDLSKCSKFQNLPDSFVNMRRLRKLHLRETKIKELPSSIGYLESLESLDLSYCSYLENFPEMVNTKCLKELLLNQTAIKELPNSIGYLESLETIDLGFCFKLEKFPKIQGNMKCLKSLHLYCTAIKELPNGIECLEALEELSLQGTAIKELPNSIGCLEALRVLRVDCCSNLEMFPKIQKNLGSLKDLSISGTAIKELPYSIGHFTGLHYLHLGNCKSLKFLPDSVCGLKSLQQLHANGCSNLEGFWEIIEELEHLQNLCLAQMAITEVPSSIECLKDLQTLELSNCENLVTLPNSIGNLTCLQQLFIRNCSNVHKLPDSLTSFQFCLKELDIGGCNLMEGAIPSDLWCLFSLEQLDLSENHICCIPTGIIQLSKLRNLFMNHCPLLEEIPKLPPSLRKIQARGCPSLKTLSYDSTDMLWSCLIDSFKLEMEDAKLNRSIFMYINGISVAVSASGGSMGIPEWVTNKSTGCEVSIELPCKWYKDGSFLGFALFFHLVPEECQGKKIYYGQQCELSISYGDQSKLVKSSWISFMGRIETIGGFQLDNQSGPYNGGSTTDPALVVSFCPQTCIPNECRSKRWKNFKACSGDNSYLYSDGKGIYKMKSCGMHLIYAQPQDDQEMESHHKRPRHF